MVATASYRWDYIIIDDRFIHYHLYISKYSLKIIVYHI